MPEFSELEQRVLRFLREEFLLKGGRPTTMHDEGTQHSAVMDKFGLTPGEYRELMSRFEAFGIASAPTKSGANGCVHISPSVVEIVRQIDNPPKQTTASTQNVVHIHNMDRSAIQQGTSASVQQVQFSNTDLKELQSLVVVLREKLATLKLNKDEGTMADESLATIERQLQLPRANTGIIRSCLESLRSIAESAAGDIAGSGIVALLTAYLKSH